TDRFAALKQGLCGYTANAQNEPGVHQLDLSLQVRQAGAHLLGPRIAIVWRPRLQDVCDEHLLARQSGALEHCVEELPCAADEWFALAVLFHAGRFADHHPLSRAIAHAEYGLSARRVQWTEVAVTHGGLEFGPATPRA